MKCMMRAASLQAGTPHLNSWRRPSRKLTSCKSSWRLCVQSARRQRRASPALSRLFPGLRARCRLSAMRETASSSKLPSPRCPSAPALVSKRQIFFPKCCKGHCRRGIALRTITKHIPCLLVCGSHPLQLLWQQISTGWHATHR